MGSIFSGQSCRKKVEAMTNPRTVQEAVLEVIDLRIAALKQIEFAHEARMELLRMEYLRHTIQKRNPDLCDDFQYPAWSVSHD